MALALATDNGGSPTVLRLEGVAADVTFANLWDFGAGSGNGVVIGDTNGNAVVSDFITEIVAGAVYTIQKDIEFGDETNTFSFASENEMIYFDDGVKVPEVMGNATLRLGDIASGYGIKGSIWSFGPSSAQDITNHANATFLSYASELHLRTSTTVSFKLGTSTFINTIFSGRHPDIAINNLFVMTSGTVTIKNSFVSRMAGFTFAVSADVENLQIHNTNTRALSFTSSVTIKGLSLTGVNALKITLSDIVLINLIGTIIPTIIVAGSIALQNTYNIHVTDKDGGDLADVTVDCEYAHLLEGSDSKTYKCIQDHTFVEGTHAPITGSDWESFWELYAETWWGGNNWQTGFDYKAGTQEFAQQTTDIYGDITEQVIQYNKWVGTTENLEARIHKFTYAHASYPDFVMNNVIVDHPLVWEFDMGQDTAALTAIVQAAGVFLLNGVTHGGATALFRLKNLTIDNATGNAIILNATTGDGIKITSDRDGIDIFGTQKGININSATRAIALGALIGIDIDCDEEAIRLKTVNDNKNTIQIDAEGVNSLALKLSGVAGDISAAEIDAIIAAIAAIPTVGGQPSIE